MEAVLATRQAFQVQGGYYGSWYTNTNNLVDTANITSRVRPQFFLSLPLDNQAHQAFVNGGYNFSDRTRGTFKVAYTRATQNEQIPVGAGVRSSPARRPISTAASTTRCFQLGQSRSEQRASPGSPACATTKSDEKDAAVPRGPATRRARDGLRGHARRSLRDDHGKLEGTYRIGQN
jgi:hypothetical protein